MLSKIKLPLLLLIAVIMLLAMLRLGVWQLDRAEQKRTILQQRQAQSAQAPVTLASLIPKLKKDQDRFRRVTANGVYLPEKSIYVDNQVVNGQVGYQVYTPLELSAGHVVLVARGWLAVGESREKLPNFDTAQSMQSLSGRLNLPIAQPPLWDDAYQVNDGPLWQYLPIDQYAEQMQLSVLPLVLELAPEPPEVGNTQFVRKWASINDEWVAKHQGYAFQWFAMAIAFLIACLVLLSRRRPAS